MSELILPRRSLLKAGAYVLGGLIAAPTIARATSLMHIDSPDNRLVFAFTSWGMQGFIPSFLNLGTVLDPIVRAQWEAQNPSNDYRFVRMGEIPESRHNWFGPHTFESREFQQDSARRLQRRIDRFKAGETTRI